MNVLMNNMSGMSGYENTVMSVACGVGIVGYGVLNYKTSRSHQWLVRTGFAIKDIQIGKKFIRFPFQNIDYINMTPKNYRFSVNSMSKEKMEFTFPAVFTIGPKNEEDSLIKYSRYLLDQTTEETNNLINKIIEGETRSMASNLSIEDIFSGRTKFKTDVVDFVQIQLNQYGLEIYNANIEELRDADSSNYFKSLSKKIQSEAENRAKVDVSEQNKLGDIGKKERDGETRQQLAIIEANTTIIEYEKQEQIIKSKAVLEKTRAEQQLIINQANIKSENESLITKMKLEKEVESNRMEMEIERQRANELASTQVRAEMISKEAEGTAQSQITLADAEYYTVVKKAEASLISRCKEAEGDLYAKQKEAEGFLEYKLKEAESINAIYKAQADGLEKVVKAFDGNINGLLSYSMVDKGIYEKLAAANATAIQGLNPKITVWTHDPNQAMDVIKNLGKTIIPMMDTITDQTKYELPDWLLKKSSK